MKSNLVKASILYDMLTKDCKRCSDVKVTLTGTCVKYQSQSGIVFLDFKERTLTLDGCLQDTFCVDTKSELGELITKDTKSIEFYKNRWNMLCARVTSQYNSDKELRQAMNELGTFMYLDLDKVFKDN